MQRSSERILTSHVGSLVRPPQLIKYAEAFAEGLAIDRAGYEASLRAAVAEVVRQQAEHGVDVVSDGEFGKAVWTGYSFERIAGFEQRAAPPDARRFVGSEQKRFREYYEAIFSQMQSLRRLLKQHVCVAPIEYTAQGRALMQRDVDNLKAALNGVEAVEAFLPVVAPCSLGISYANEYYKSEEQFLFAIAEAQHEEYKVITDAGFLLQVDDAILANMYDAVVDSGRDYRSWVQLNIEALNHALRGIPEERVRYHLCWGSWPGPHTSDVPLAEIADLLITIRAQAYSIEAANPRHEHEWTVWQQTKLPEGKILLPGCVCHAITHVEHPELIAQRIVRYANVVGRENVIASTDCGFAQAAEVARQHPQVVWAKLDSLAEGARLATQRLWS